MYSLCMQYPLHSSTVGKTLLHAMKTMHLHVSTLAHILRIKYNIEECDNEEIKVYSTLQNLYHHCTILSSCLACIILFNFQKVLAKFCFLRRNNPL
jgi:hypothetical protein